MGLPFFPSPPPRKSIRKGDFHSVSVGVPGSLGLCSKDPKGDVQEEIPPPPPPACRRDCPPFPAHIFCCRETPALSLGRGAVSHTCWGPTVLFLFSQGPEWSISVCGDIGRVLPSFAVPTHLGEGPPPNTQADARGHPKAVVEGGCKT